VHNMQRILMIHSFYINWHVEKAY